LNFTSPNIIAMSTVIERVFSKGHQLLHFTRNHLSEKLPCWTFLCLGSWSRHDLVGDKEFQSAVRENMKGKGGGTDGHHDD
ncbi:hypothetical protein K438DRAFT_1557905, partial [Mycena galopus ATCC 62051]